MNRATNAGPAAGGQDQRAEKDGAAGSAFGATALPAGYKVAGLPTPAVSPGWPDGQVLGLSSDGPALRVAERTDTQVAELLDDLAAQLGYRIRPGKNGPVLVQRDGKVAETWREDYPYGNRLSRKEYERAKRVLQVELLKLQRHLKGTGGRLVIVFEGRDAAGKGGTIKRFMENLNPRGARVIALERPTEREQSDWYLKRYVAHLPAAGEIVLFDRSWYNRSGVERVMGFCGQDECQEFLREAPEFERMLARDGIALTKFWFSVSRGEQLSRFVRRQLDPVKKWKLSHVDLASLDKWDAYTEAKEATFFFTDVADAPWTVVKSNDKRRARLEAMRYVLSRVRYEGRDDDLVSRPDPLIVGPAPLLRETGEHAGRLTAVAPAS
ncbi:MAG: polyphosphate kinase 2 [Streptosporangiaceae bacterium]